MGVQGSKITKQRLATPASSRRSALSWRSWIGLGSNKEVVKIKSEAPEEEEAVEDLDGPTLVGDDDDQKREADGDEYVPEENMSDHDESDDEGKTLVASSKRSRSKAVKNYEEEYNSDDEDEPSPTATKADASSIIPSLEDERKKREEVLKQITEGGWAKGEVAVYQKLTMRGFEPLLPTLWAHDFKTIPSNLFAGSNQETVINSVSGNDFRGIC